MKNPRQELIDYLKTKDFTPTQWEETLATIRFVISEVMEKEEVA